MWSSRSPCRRWGAGPGSGGLRSLFHGQLCGGVGLETGVWYRPAAADRAPVGAFSQALFSSSDSVESILELRPDRFVRTFPGERLGRVEHVALLVGGGAVGSDRLIHLG